MQVYFGIDTLPEHFKGTVATLGVFDGLHLAHMEIINRVIRRAHEKKKNSMLITFDPHPRKVLSNSDEFSLPILTTTKEKIKLLNDTFLDAALFLMVDKKFLNMSDEDFVKNILVDQLGVNELIVGYDYHFGKNRRGNPELLKSKEREFGFFTQVVPLQKVEGDLISSSLIRELLLEGNVEKAGKLLGRPYSFMGHIIIGSGRGKELGFPTANIKLNNSEKLIPANGVYFTRAFIREIEYFGICNIGVRLTFNESDLVIEVHIVDSLEENLYGSEIEVQFLERLRNEIKFKSEKELKKQVYLDKQNCLRKVKDYKISNGG